ncbi:MAG: hypothetical protein N2202_03820 [Proteobacteria bacterium]|nr:hypothetical protein [Pseudomonadota bacterium]
MRKLFLLLLFFILCGFGIFPEDENKLPDVVPNYKIQITDTDGYSIELTNVSINNLLYLSGKHSKADLVIDFKNIDKIIFKNLDEKNLSASVYMKNGENISLLIKGNLKLKGKSKYGIFSIALKDLRELKMLGIINKE